MKNNILKYFNKNASCLNVRGIELAAGVSPKTLDHFLKGRRQLTEKNAKKIIEVLKLLRYKL
jgi:DNA-binding LacI/PurR family transcriptional regulator